MELDPNAWQGHLELAQVLLAQGRITDAEVHARRAYELMPTLPLVHVVLGNVALRKGNLRTGRQEFQQFLDLAPGNPLGPAVREKLTEIDQAQRRNP